MIPIKGFLGSKIVGFREDFQIVVNHDNSLIVSIPILVTESYKKILVFIY